MRSFLAGLRRLVVPWGAGPLVPAVIIDGAPTQEFIDAFLEASILWQYPAGSNRRAFIAAVQSVPSGGFWQLVEADLDANPLTYTQLIAIDTGTDGSGSARIGPGGDNFVQVDWDATQQFAGAFIPPPTAVNFRDVRITENTNSATLIPVGGGLTFQVPKTWVHSQLLIIMSATWFTATANTGAVFGVRIDDGTNSYDLEVAGPVRGTSPVGVRQQANGTAICSDPLDNTTLDIEVLWARANGTGTVQAVANDDNVSVTVLEVRF